MKKYINDIILIVILLVISFSSYIYLMVSENTENCKVAIVVNGEEETRISLNRDCEYTVANQYGTNIITIKDSKVSVKYADCTDNLCVKHSGISRSGEAIVCLPHKLIVTIDDDDEVEIDAVAE